MARRLLLGFDVGSSSVKASLVDADTGKCAASTSEAFTELLPTSNPNNNLLAIFVNY